MNYVEEIKQQGRQEGRLETIERFLQAGIGWPVIQSATGIDEQTTAPQTRLRQRHGADCVRLTLLRPGTSATASCASAHPSGSRFMNVGVSGAPLMRVDSAPAAGPR